MKRLKSIITVTLILAIFVCTLATPAGATFINTGDYVLINEGGFLGIGQTPYKYDIYKDNISWYAMFGSGDVCYPIYHAKNAGQKTLTYELTATYSSQTAYEFASNWSVSASAEVVEATVGKGYSIAKTISVSYSATGGVAATIPSYADTGYYKMTICHNFEKYQFYKYDKAGEFVGSNYYAALPVGLPYLAVLYSTSSGSGYSIYG